MSYFLFSQDDDQVLIVTDTLAVDQDDRPAIFAHKVWSLPTLNMVMAVTGASGVGDEFFRFLSTVPGPRDVTDVDNLAPDLLRQIDAGLRATHGDVGTATLYVFGFPTDSSQLLRYTYRSTLSYESARDSGSAVAVKPAPATFTAEVPNTLDEHIALALKVREEQDGGRSPEPVKIGGDLFLTMFQNGTCSTARIYTFPDKDVHLTQMREADRG